jgi:hypothetical protein
VIGSREVILCGWVGGSGAATKKLQVVNIELAWFGIFILFFFFLKRDEKK